MTYELSEELLAKANEGGAAKVDPSTSLTEDVSSKAKELPSNESQFEVSDELIQLADNVAKGSGSGIYAGGDVGIDPREHDFQLSYNSDNNYIIADRQSAAGMLAKGAGRLVSTTATKLLQSAGYAATAIPALLTGDMSTMVDNGFSSLFAGAEESLKEAMPIHKTRKYTEGGLLNEMLTLGFWTDDVVDGAAFMLSSLVGAKGMGAASKGLGAYSKLAKVFSNTSRAIKTGNASQMSNLALKKFTDAATMATISTVNSVGEASFEAKDVKDSLMQSFKGKIEAGLMTEEEANIKASEAARTTFWMNMAILSPSNYLETSMFLKKSDKLGLNKIFAKGKSAGKTGREIAEELPTALTGKQKAGLFAKDALLSSISEGVYEENMQTALQNYVTDRAHGKEENRGLIRGLTENWKENFSTYEGQKAIALGAIIGLVPGGIGGIRAAKDENINRNKQAMAVGTSMDMARTNMKDFYKRKVEKDAEGNIVGEGSEFELDTNGNPVLDESKMAAMFEKSKGQYIRYAEGLKALAGGNMEAHEFITNEAFSDYALGILHGGNELEVLDHLIDSFVQGEVEDMQTLGLLDENNAEEIEEYTEKANLKYKRKAEQLSKIYKSVSNNYAGIQSFGKTKEAVNFQQNLLREQYLNASEQAFFNEKAEELRETIAKGRTSGRGTISGVDGLIDVESTDAIAEGKRAEKILKQIDNRLVDAKSRMIELMDTKKQQSIFDELVESLHNESESKGTNTDDDSSIAGKAADLSNKDPQTIKLSDTVSTSTLTPEQATANGYTEDAIRSEIVNQSTGATGPSYYYKKSDDNNTVDIIYTDGTEEGNIINRRTLTGRETIDPVTGDRGRLTLNYFNDQLEKVSNLNLETGETTQIRVSDVDRLIGRRPQPSDSPMVFYNILPRLGGFEYTDNPTTTLEVDRLDAYGDEIIPQKTLDQHRNDVVTELADTASEVAKRNISDAKKAAESIENRRIVIGSESMTPKELFDKQGNNIVPASYNNLTGYIKQEGGENIFVSVEEGNKEYLIGGAESSVTFRELGVSVLSHSDINVKYETDGRPYPININGKYYKNPYYANPSDTIQTRNNEPIAVELVDVNGKWHRFTEPMIVQSVAYGIEMNEALIDRIFDFKLFGQESDAIIIPDPKTGVEYAVYRKDGQYEVYFLREGEATRGYKQVKPMAKIYHRVVKETNDILSKVLDKASKNNYKTEKELKDGIKSNVQDARPATAGEALTIPDQREVQSSKRVAPEKQEKSESQVESQSTKELEKEVVKSVEDKALIEQEAKDRFEQQEVYTEEALETKELAEKGDAIEPVGEEFDSPETKQSIRNDEEWNGKQSTSNTISYVHYNDVQKAFVANNGEFLKHAINTIVGNGRVQADIDFEYREFWDKHSELEQRIKSNNITGQELQSLLESKVKDDSLIDRRYPEFDTLADFIPIKYTYRDGSKSFTDSLFAHQSNFPYITIPSGLIAGLSPAEANKASREYKLEKMREMKSLRTKILSQKLSGNSIEFNVTNKLLGHFNAVNENAPLGDIISELEGDVREQVFGVATTNGRVYIPGQELSVATGSKGNIYWYTNNTANGQYVPVKLNPSRLSREHGEIVLKALRQANNGSLKDIYSGSEVTGGLTLQEVLNHLVLNGKKNTQVDPSNKSKTKYIQKQLWTTMDGKLQFGTEIIDLHNPTKAEEQRFLDWITTNKNYPVNRPMLGKRLAKDFTIGSTMKYNASVDNYSSFIINSGLLQTRLRVVEGTKSITTNPLMLIDEQNPIMSSGVLPQPASQGQVAPIVQTDTKAAPKQEVADSDPVVKESVEQLNKTGAKKTTEIKVPNIPIISRFRVGSTVYFYNPDISQAKFPLGQSMGNGKFKVTDQEFSGQLSHLNDALSGLDVLSTPEDFAKLEKAVGKIYADFLHVDHPSTTAEVVKEEVNKLDRFEYVSEEVKNRTEALVNQIQANASFIKLSDDGSTYINTNDPSKTYIRVSEFISDREIESNKLLESSQIIGTKVDELVRDFFAGELKPLSEYDVSDEKELVKFISRLKELNRQFKISGQRVLAKEIVLYNDDLGVAGTVDLLTYDGKGNFYIYDMKTMRGNNFVSTGYGIPYDSTTVFEKTGELKPDGSPRYRVVPGAKQASKREMHTRQLSMYNILMNNTHGINAKELRIVPIEIKYNAGDRATSKLSLYPTFPLNKMDSVKGATLEEQTTSSEEVSDLTLSTEVIDSTFGPMTRLVVNDGKVTAKDQKTLSDVNNSLKSQLGVSDNVLEFIEGAFGLTVNDEYAEDVNNLLTPSNDIKSDDNQTPPANSGFENTGASDFSDIDDGAFRLVDTNKKDYRKFNPNKARRWLRNKLGKNFSIEIADGLIELANDKHAFGQARVDSITLSDAAEVGTEYHEAFHRVSLFLLEDSARESLYKSARKKYDLKDKTDSEVEEVLAEKYRDYQLLKEEGYEQQGLLASIKKFFERVYNYIKSVFVGPGRLDNLDDLQLFKLIDDGRFRFKQVNFNKLKQLRGKFANFAVETTENDSNTSKFETRDTVFDEIQSTEEYEEVIKYLFRQLASASGLITSYSDIKTRKRDTGINLTNGLNDISKLSYPLLKDRIINLRNQYQSVAVNNKVPGAEGEAIRFKANKIAKLLTEVDEKFNVIRQDLQAYLDTLNIKTIDEIEDSESMDDESLGQYDMRSDFENFSKVAFESSSKDNTAGNMKLLLSILPDSDNSRDSKTGLPMFADFGQTWSSLLRDNLNTTNVEDLMNVLKSKSDGNFAYKKLLQFVEQDENIKIKLWNTVNKARLDFVSNYVNVTEDGDVEVKVGSAMAKNQSSEKVKAWNSTMTRDASLFTFKQGENPIPNAEYFNSLSDRYNQLVESTNKEYRKTGGISNSKAVIADLRELLGSIGISISEQELDVVLASIDQIEDVAILKFMENKIPHIFGEEGTLYKLFNNSITSKNVNFDNAFNNEKNIKWLADKVASIDVLGEGDSLIAHDGKRFYLVSQHTNLTNQLNDFKKNPAQEVAKKLGAVYNKNSLLLKYFKDNPEQIDKFSIKTLASIFREETADPGRGYQDVTDLEEYVLRLNSNNKGYMVLPTPEARSFYQYLRLEGNREQRDAIRVPVGIDSSGNLNQEALDIFMNYYSDEAERIKLTKGHIQQAIQGNFRVEDLVENLHFEFFGDKEVQPGQVVMATDVDNNWIVLPEGARALHGNGKLFIRDASIQRTKDGTFESYKLIPGKTRYANKINGIKHIVFPSDSKGLNTISNREDLQQYIKDVLADRIKDELDYAVQLGVIGIVNGEYKNIYIPESVMDKHRDIVGENEDLVIRNIISDNTLNTISGGLEMSKFFTSDIASFKGVPDYVKRLTGYTSTGDNLATDIPSGIYENDSLITSNDYNVTTFTSHEIRSEMYDNLIKLHSEYYANNLDWDSGLTKEEIAKKSKEIAERKLSGLLEVDQTDAQTYITSEMYRAISVKLGEWSDLKERAYKLLNSGKKLAHREMIEAYNLVSQPLKLTYMKTYQTNGQSYSVFDKMSLATLYRPTVEGTQMEELLDRMEKKKKIDPETNEVLWDYTDPRLAPIHQVKFHTAEKAGIKDRRSLFSDERETSFNDLTTVTIYQQEFKQLRKQLVTDPHEASTIPLGVQMKKIGMANVVMGDKYVNRFDSKEEMSGEAVVRNINNLISELSDRGADIFKNDLKLDENYVVVDKSEFIKTLRKEAKASALPQHVVDSLRYDEASNDFYLELDAMPEARKWFQSRAISLIKKATIDLNLPGGSFIQMSNVALRKERSDELKWDDGNGNIEVQVSVNLFKKIIPGYRNKTHEQRVAWLEAREEELFSMAYRVPTQEQNSTLATKVTKWLPENTGDVIILPAEVTAFTGADFDVDKMYMVRHNYKNGERIKYLTRENSDDLTRAKAYAEQALKDEISDIRKEYLRKENIAIEGVQDYKELTDSISKGLRDSMNLEIDLLKDEWVKSNLESFSKRPIIKQNTDLAVQNRLLDMYFTVWHNRNHAARRTQPLGDGTSRLRDLAYYIKDELEQQDSIEGTPLKYLTPIEQIDVKSRFKFGGKGIGPNALATVHHILSQSVDLGLFYDLGVGNTVPMIVSETEASSTESYVDPDSIDKYRLAPGITANKEQRSAIDSMIDFIKSGDKKQWFSLEGKAGTGKTTIIKKVLEQFPSQSKSVAALSHKAKGVLIDSLESNDSPLVNVNYETIASLLGMTMDLETGRFIRPKDNVFQEEPPISYAKIIVVDESSMVNEEALELIMSLKSPDATVIFSGDIGQLPPIRPEGSHLADKNSRTFNSKNKSKLLNRVRQGESSPILPFADNYWNNSMSKSPQLSPISDGSRKDIISENGNLIFTKGDVVLKSAIEQFRKAVDNNDSNLVKIIAYRNNTIDRLNKYIHETLFPNQLEYNKGELLMFNSPHSIEDYDFNNSDEIQVLDSKQVKLGNNLTGYKITTEIYDKDGVKKPVSINVLDTNSKPIHRNIVSNLFNEASKKPIKTRERAIAYQEAWAEKNRYADLNYAYAITSHKSQGSTYNTSIIYEDDIMSVGPISNKQKSQSMYTAITRARNNAVIVSNKNVNSTGQIPILDRAAPVDEESIDKVDQPITPSATPEQSKTKISTKPVTTLSALRGKDNEYITEWFSALVDAHVDIAADPWIYYLNANDYTTPTITLLIRAGVGGLETFRFIAQPILKEIAKSHQNVAHKLDYYSSDSQISKRKKKATEDIINRYKAEYIKLGGDINKLTEGTTAVVNAINNQKGLISNLAKVGEQNFDLDFYRDQLNIYNAFQELQQPSNDLKEVILSSRIDTKKIGGSNASVRSYDSRVQFALAKTRSKNGIRNFDRLMTETYLGAQSDNTIGIINSVVGSTLIEGSSAFNGLMDGILDRLGFKYKASEKLINRLAAAVYNQIDSEFFVYNKNSNQFGMKPEHVNKLFTGKRSIPKQIEEIKSGIKWPHLMNNKLLSLLTPVYKQDTKDFLSVKKLKDKFEIDGAVTAWKDLLRDPNSEVRKFANDLFKYSYFTSGFKPSANSFHNLIPKELLKASGYNDFIKSIKSKSLSSDGFSHMFDDVIKNLWSDANVVPVIDGKDVMSSAYNSAMITVPYSKYGVAINNTTDLIGKPYIRTKAGDLYKFGGYLPMSEELVYYKTNKSSYRDGQFYLSENGFSETIISDNKKGVPQKLNDNTFLDYATYVKNGVPLAGEISDVIIPDTNQPLAIPNEIDESRSSEQISKQLLINPISKFASEQTIDIIKAGEGVLEVDLSNLIESGFYMLENGEIIYIDNSNPNVTMVDKSYGFRTPSLAERQRKIEEC